MKSALELFYRRLENGGDQLGRSEQDGIGPAWYETVANMMAQSPFSAG